MSTPERPPVLTPIGVLRTPFATLSACPRNGRAPAPPPLCRAELLPAFHEGLRDLGGFSHLILLYWLARTVPALTVTPRSSGVPRGVFATRAPCRPNPIGLSVVRLEGIEAPGTLLVRHLDCLDGTLLLDLKPYLPRTDSEPGASIGWMG